MTPYRVLSPALFWPTSAELQLLRARSKGEVLTCAMPNDKGYARKLEKLGNVWPRSVASDIGLL